MTTDDLKRLPHLTASEVGECLRVKTASGWRLTDGERYCTRLFCALTAELPDYKITDGKETYPTETETETPSDSPKGETAEAETDNADKAAGETAPAADAAESETQGEVVANCNRLPDAAAEADTAAQEYDRNTTAGTTEYDRVTTAGETETQTAETSKGWAARAWTAACEWCAKAWADACEWCAGVWRKMTNKG